MADKAKVLASLSVLFVAAGARAAFTEPTWSRANAYSTYQAWETFASPTGPNAPNVAPTVEADPHNTNGVANVYDTSGMSFVTSGGNIYSFSGPTHIVSAVPDFGLGADYVTTVLFQTRTQGNEPVYAGASGYRLVYSDAGGSHTVYPVSAAELGRQALGGFGGSLVDYATLFDIPASATSFAVYVDASDASMSLDRVSIDTLTTRATGASALLAGMDPTVGFAGAAVPEPGVATMGIVALPLLSSRRRRT